MFFTWKKLKIFYLFQEAFEDKNYNRLLNRRKKGFKPSDQFAFWSLFIHKQLTETIYCYINRFGINLFSIKQFMKRFTDFSCSELSRTALILTQSWQDQRWIPKMQISLQSNNSWTKSVEQENYMGQKSKKRGLKI